MALRPTAGDADADPGEELLRAERGQDGGNIEPRDQSAGDRPAGKAGGEGEENRRDEVGDDLRRRRSHQARSPMRNVAATMAERFAVPTTPRSIPPVIMVRLMPTAMMPYSGIASSWS